MPDPAITIDPATGEELERYPRMSEAEAKAAVDRCHAAFEDWRLTTHEHRAGVLRALGKALRERKEELAQIMSREVGKLIGDSRDEIDLCAGICDYTAEQGPKELAEETRDPANAKRGIVTYQPIGVIYGIQPWNFPAYQVVRYAIANLMTGNGVLLKHAENCTGSGLRLREIFEDAGLPENLFTVLVIDHDVSDAIIAHDKVRGVTLTGSDTAGSAIAEQAGRLNKKTVLELGSNDAYLVLEDADVDLAAKTCAAGRLYNNGETCINAKRFIVTDAVHDEFMEKFTAAMEAARPGDPFDEETGLGPMAREDLREKLQAQVDESIEKGARVVTGCQIPEGRGWFYPPSILADVAPGQPAYDDELFGPVASVIRAKDDEDAMRLANDSRYGLGGGIFSKDEDRAIRLAAQHFDTGMVFVNTFGVADPSMPFGGVKNSGYGREHGGCGVKEFANAKSIFVG
ncbi:NAD-dependent succinate-semialdehyde dehydrogenase [Erythrobacter sp. HL-111]|uniref:NAD-dependent succinate-semialdehyde dehydrogenase n=1 Tax=Erythrobacter sp. HL-111 TaxID=1798193 RepID=UPI0006DB0DE8|nr:NAD-dependent succinate-semialdehyde dehydrogenase [Erythrobacter sp. HL-111]KPP82403.1 MAG: succinate-semialdehyde dehydrogenase / glutarate-semialdehyde dehydrogenase [Erythrobacteraceae bacterium HL-111]SDR86694.1 succinate-semialdehyde dehydrogenase / glutarate-semialdehyde dehydrogenase [Erythrobacter sp. HL-111]